MNNERLLKILLSPHVTSKSYKVSNQTNHVVFKVLTDSTKQEIKQAVEKLFDVKIDKVRTINVKGKSHRVGRIEGRTKNWKKAVIRLSTGYNISFDLE